MHPRIAGRADCVVLLTDVQVRFLPAVWQPERLVANCRKLLEAARILQVPALATEQYPEGLGPTLPDLAPLITVRSPIPKLTFSGYTAEPVRRELRHLGRRTAVLCGLESHVCVSQTTHDLLEQGFKVHVVADALTSRTEANWRTGLDRMREAGAILTSTEMVVFEWLQEAGTPAFKQVQALFKD